MDVKGNGLDDKPGEVWYLVSPPIGCEGWNPKSKDKTRVKRNTGPKDDCEHLGHQILDAKVWVRRVVLETLSKDQGWSSESGRRHYGD